MRKLTKIVLCASLLFSCAEKETARPEAQLANGAVFTEDKSASVRLTWPESLIALEYIEARLEFFALDGALIAEVSDIEFIPEMPSMGHGTDMEDQVISKVSNGVYAVTGVFLNMGGPWVITVRARINGSMKVAKVAVDVP